MSMKVTDWLAIYGAVLSTLIFAWNAFHSRPRLKVVTVFGMEDGLHGAHISVQNRSPHTVHLSSISILYRYRETSLKEWLSNAWEYKRIPRRLGWVYSHLSNHSVEDGCPLALEARNSHHVLIPDAVLESIFRDALERKIIAVVQDKIWNNVYSNALVYAKPPVSIAGA